MQPASSARFGELYGHFAELHSLGGLERSSRLELLRAQDASLARELEQLLRADETSAGFLETLSEVDLAELVAGAEASLPTPERIGKYRVLGVLGEGGMGVVYRAEQESPRRTVALKVLKGELATPRRLRRFEHEAELLGRLQHPGIAQVFEAGAADVGGGPRPFMAMELVEGVDLRAHARSRAIDVRARLELMIQICEAVAHAHQKGVVHRDLKPENVLVDRAGRPKVLDFGVARLIGHDGGLSTLHTQEGTLLGTPWTMSPEQLAGDPDAADTRSDVYALGVIGYELFAGRLPYELEGKPLAEVARIIRDEEPAPLVKRKGERRAGRELPADLVTVIEKCLEKDPARRYASASELAGDLARVLSDEPISARPPSGTYLLRKFVRRNRGLSAGLAAAALAVLLAAVVFAVQAVRVARQRDRALGAEEQAESALEEAGRERDRAVAAEKQAEQSLAEANRERDKFEASFEFLNEMLRAVDATRDGHDVRVADLLVQGSQMLAGRFADEPTVEGELRRSFGTAWRSLGKPGDALPEFRKALELLEESGDPRADVDYARDDVALALSELGRYDEAEPLFLKSLEHQRATLGPRALETLSTLSYLTSVIIKRGDLLQAEELLREVLEAEAELERSATSVTSPWVQRRLFHARQGLASLLREKGEFAEARAVAETALADAQATFGERSPEVLGAIILLGWLEWNMGDLESAMARCEQGLSGFTEKLPPEHPTLLSLEFQLGWMFVRAGRAEEGERRLRKGYEGLRKLLGSEHPDTVVSTYHFADALVELDRFAEAETLLRESLAGLERAFSPGHWLTSMTNEVLGKCLMRMGKLEEAEQRLEQSYAGLIAAFGPTAPRTQHALALLIELHEKRGDLERAEELREQMRSSEAPPPDPGG